MCGCVCIFILVAFELNDEPLAQDVADLQELRDQSIKYGISPKSKSLGNDTPPPSPADFHNDKSPLDNHHQHFNNILNEEITTAVTAPTAVSELSNLTDQSWQNDSSAVAPNSSISGKQNGE